MGLVLIALVAGIVYKAAEMGYRNGFLWGALSVLISIGWGMYLPFGFAAGLVGPLLIMLVANLINDPSQGR